jgi:hypothetical protein
MHSVMVVESSAYKGSFNPSAIASCLYKLKAVAIKRWPKASNQRQSRR